MAYFNDNCFKLCCQTSVSPLKLWNTCTCTFLAFHSFITNIASLFTGLQPSSYWSSTVCKDLPCSQTIFLYREGKNRLVSGLFRFCSVRFKHWWHNIFKNVLCDVPQSLKLWKSLKETCRFRDNPSLSFQTLRNEDFTKHEASINLRKPLDNLINIWKLRNFTLPVVKLRNTHHLFTEVLAFLHQLFSGPTRLILLHSASTA